jgi:hypothetical protein
LDLTRVALLALLTGAVLVLFGISAPAERHHVGSVFYFLLVGLVSLLTHPKDKTVVGAGLVSPAAEEAVSTRGTTSPGQPRATTGTSAKTALARIRHCLRRALLRRRYK